MAIQRYNMPMQPMGGGFRPMGMGMPNTRMPTMGGGMGMTPTVLPYTIQKDPFILQEIGRQQGIANVFKQQRQEDMLEGQRRGMQLFGPGSLGRLDESDNKRLLEIYRGRQDGYTAPEFAAMRDTMNRNIARNAKGQEKDLIKAQGMSGLTGPAATAQMAKLAKDTDRNTKEQYQDFLIKNIEAKKQGTADFASALQRLQGVQSENMGRAEKELLNRFQTEMGYASLGSAERAAASQFGAAATQQQAAAMKKEGGKF